MKKYRIILVSPAPNLEMSSKTSVFHLYICSFRLDAHRPSFVFRDDSNC